MVEVEMEQVEAVVVEMEEVVVDELLFSVGQVEELVELNFVQLVVVVVLDIIQVNQHRIQQAAMVVDLQQMEVAHIMARDMEVVVEQSLRVEQEEQEQGPLQEHLVHQDKVVLVVPQALDPQQVVVVVAVIMVVAVALLQEYLQWVAAVVDLLIQVV